MGWRIAVYWKTDQTFYPGTVQAFDATTGRHHVVYADGDEEHLCLSNESLKWLLPPPFRVSSPPPPSQRFSTHVIAEQHQCPQTVGSLWWKLTWLNNTAWTDQTSGLVELAIESVSSSSRVARTRGQLLLMWGK